MKGSCIDKELHDLELSVRRLQESNVELKKSLLMEEDAELRQAIGAYLNSNMQEEALQDLLRPLLLPDLRIECRARNISPAGSRATLLERLRQDMVDTGDYTLKGQHPGNQASVNVADRPNNNYCRPEGQNVGNFLTDRNSSRVLAPPGGKTSVIFGDIEDSPKAPQKNTASIYCEANSVKPLENANDNVSNAVINASNGHSHNNYHRSEGQNVGNFLTDRASSRVLAPPGGHSSISFG